MYNDPIERFYQGILTESANDIQWKYKIDVKDKSVFMEIEKSRKIHFPGQLKSFVMKTNAATPSKHKFMVGDTERVFGAVLSFNHDDSDNVFSALRAVRNKDYLPFAVDSFGNFICYSLSNKKIYFWNHEKGTFDPTGYSLSKLIKSLY